MQIPAGTKPAIYGAIAGAAIVALVGFSWGGWVTGSTAEEMAAQRADAAVVSVLTPVCVAEFRRGADSAAQLAALKETKSWDQGKFVKEGGWADLPGGGDGGITLARACASALTEES